MIRKSALATVLLSASLFGAKPSILHDSEDFERPGVLRFHGVSERDEVRIDGELVTAKGLARTNYNLMVAPGEYIVSVKLAGSVKECISAVKVAAGTTVIPRCVRPTFSQTAD